jgi:hypothetical protein
MNRGQLPARLLPTQLGDGHERSSGRNTICRNTPSTIISPARSQPRPRTEVSQGVRAHTTSSLQRAHAPPPSLTAPRRQVSSSPALRNSRRNCVMLGTRPSRRSGMASDAGEALAAVPQGVLTSKLPGQCGLRARSWGRGCLLARRGGVSEGGRSTRAVLVEGSVRRRSVVLSLAAGRPEQAGARRPIVLVLVGSREDARLRSEPTRLVCGARWLIVRTWNSPIR